MADRRRFNAPAGGTNPPIFVRPRKASTSTHQPKRSRSPSSLRKVFLRTGLVPSASGSSYLELHSSSPKSNSDNDQSPNQLFSGPSSLKVTCTVHGPRPLPRNTPFSSTLILNTHVKFAPFATRVRRGYVRNAAERDLGVHLETALRGVIIGERWPKSAVEVVVTVLEGEEDGSAGHERGTEASKSSLAGYGMMNVLAGCITAASAAIVDAGIDCLDLLAGGVAAVVEDEGAGVPRGKGTVVLDPNLAEHQALQAACVVAYLQSRDEITELWMKGNPGSNADGLVDRAVEAATIARTVLAEAVREGAKQKLALAEGETAGDVNGHAKKQVGDSADVDMKG